MGISEEAGKATIGFMDALKREPLSLALVLMNICLLLFFYVAMIFIGGQRANEIAMLHADNKEVREMMSKCVVPNGRH